MASSKITPSEMAVFKADFAKLDLDGSNLLDPERIELLAEKQLEKTPSADEMKIFMSQVGTDADGKISLEGYLNAVLGKGWAVVDPDPETSPPLMMAWCCAKIEEIKKERNPDAARLDQVNKACLLTGVHGDDGAFADVWNGMFVEVDQAPFDMFFYTLKEKLAGELGKDFANSMQEFESELKAGWFHMAVSLASDTTAPVDYNAEDGPVLKKGDYDWGIFMKVLVALTCMEILKKK